MLPKIIKSVTYVDKDNMQIVAFITLEDERTWNCATFLKNKKTLDEPEVLFQLQLETLKNAYASLQIEWSKNGTP